jgi:hypothetical protein
MTMTMMTQEKEGARYDMGEREPVADMIEAAARHIGAEVFWHDPKKTALRYHATISLNGEEVCVEAGYPKQGARISSDYGSRDWDYTGMASLAAAVKRRMRSAKARDVEQRRRWDEAQQHKKSELIVRKAAREELVRVFGEELVEAAVYVDADFSAEEGVAVVKVNVYVGRKIDGQKLTLGEAVRFIQAMISAGYDLVKLNNDERAS